MYQPELDLFGEPVPMKRKTVAALEKQYDIIIRLEERPWEDGQKWVIRDYFYRKQLGNEKRGAFTNLQELERDVMWDNEKEV